jgi:hypothetical protein
MACRAQEAPAGSPRSVIAILQMTVLVRVSRALRRMVTGPARGGQVRRRPAGCQPAGHGQQPVLTDDDRGEIGIAWKRFTQHRCLIKYALTVGHWALDVVLSSGGTTGRMH